MPIDLIDPEKYHQMYDVEKQSITLITLNKLIRAVNAFETLINQNSMDIGKLEERMEESD